jgi:hypothetical protein
MGDPVLIDLFCGAGGAAEGYRRAGFRVVGVDINPQPNYPFEFHQADAMTYPLAGFDVVHASPPCQAYSTSTSDKSRHPDLVAAVRSLLIATAGPYVIENVPGAPLFAPMVLCGHAFGLAVRRHRLFESNIAMLSPGCACDSGEPIGVYGDHPQEANYRRPDGTRRGKKARTLDEARAAMGIDWMGWPELTQAIPPSFTQFIGDQIMAELQAAA